MPSLLPASPISPSAERYSPLADEHSPVFGSQPSHPSTRHGAVEYERRIASTSTVSSWSESEGTTLHQGLRSESEETLSQSTYSQGKGKGKGKAVAQQEGYDLDGENGKASLNERDTAARTHGDIYGVTGNGKADYKGKGRQLTWEEEHGRVEDMYGEAATQYPPTNEEEEEERRIQENLARMAARDQARRRAARQSRNLGPASPDLSAGGGGVLPRPASLFGSGAGLAKRGSLMGIVGGFWGSATSPRSPPVAPDREVALGRTSTNASENPFSNPYEGSSPERPRGHTSPIPSMKVTPPYDPPNPFTDPSSPNRNTRSGEAASETPRSTPASLPSSPEGPARAGDPRSSSSTTRGSASAHGSPIDGGAGFSYGYVGPAWRGGQGIRLPDGPGGPRGFDQPEKWWHALCAWGTDLDGGDDDPDNQAGRTNPFE